MEQEKHKPDAQRSKPPGSSGDEDSTDLAAEREKAVTIGNSISDIVSAALSSDPKKFLKANTQPSGE